MVYIIVGLVVNLILEFLEEWSIENFEEIFFVVIFNFIKIFVNGLWVGIYCNFELFV